MVYAGLDIGTTGCKISLFEDLKALGTFYEAYASSRSAEKDEIDAREILRAAKKVIQEAYAFRKDLSAIGVTSFGETFVLLDSEDHVLMPSILYSDPRGKAEAEELRSTLGSKRIGEITGLMVHEMFSLPKLLSIRKSHPEVWAQVDKVLLMQDYVVYSLTGVRQIDESLASRTMLFDCHKRKWSEEIFSFVNLKPSLFSTPVPSGTKAGKIRIEGIPTNVDLYNVSHDQVAVAIGCGLKEESTLVDGCGTCECLIPFFRAVPKDSRIYDGGYGVVPYVVNQGYISYPLIFSGGALAQWFVTRFAPKGEDPYGYFDRQIDPNAPSKILLSPYFLGSGTPDMDSSAQGAMYGLNISTEPKDIYQACLEGVAYELRRNIDILKSMGMNPQRIFATGGGSQNKKWLQIKANILGLPVTAMKNKDAGTIGTAIVVGTSIGLFSSLEEGMERLVQPGETYVPNLEAKKQYDALYENYLKMVQGQKELK